MTRIQPALFLMMAALAASVPFVSRASGPPETSAFPGWPSRHENRAIALLPPAPEDAWLARQFPGRIARFSDGKRQIVLRWVAGPTRLLHPAVQCFRAAGYTIGEAPVRRLADGATMGCFRASKDGRAVLACERIFDARQSWPDVSSWYWHALLNRAPEGYWAVLEVGTAGS
uniref:hypothetical protein n=1 Tax=uncultured Sphingomonas sp. TaxID=158754 RepID=UPI0025F5AF6D|nr:hypothetical protein [uncultured Sphingomonas sp.]